jgi:hypothetical protein
VSEAPGEGGQGARQRAGSLGFSSPPRTAATGQAVVMRMAASRGLPLKRVRKRGLQMIKQVGSERFVRDVQAGALRAIG